MTPTPCACKCHEPQKPSVEEFLLDEALLPNLSPLERQTAVRTYIEFMEWQARKRNGPLGGPGGHTFQIGQVRGIFE